MLHARILFFLLLQQWGWGVFRYALAPLPALPVISPPPAVAAGAVKADTVGAGQRRSRGAEPVKADVPKVMKRPAGCKAKVHAAAGEIQWHVPLQQGGNNFVLSAVGI